MKGDNGKDLAGENLKRISASFELELLRLIRTLNLISQSRELYKNQVDQFQQLTDKYKFGLSDFTIRLLDAERKLRERAPGPEAENPYAAPEEAQSAASPVIELIEEFREYLNGIGAELERSKSLYVNKLDSIYSMYNLELGASQKDLDMKLLRLQKEIARFAEAKPAHGKLGERREGYNAASDASGVRESEASVKADFNSKEQTESRGSGSQANFPDRGREKITGQPAHASPAAARGQTEREPLVKSAYIAGAVLLIIGVIAGVVFYDLLLKKWGVQEYADVETIDSSAGGDTGTGRGIDEGAETSVPDDNIASSQAGEPAEWEKSVRRPPAEAEEIPGGGEFETRDTVAADGPDGDAGGARIYTVKGTGANVRTGPGVSYDIVTVVRTGQEFRGTGGRSGHWITILAPDGKEGWVSGKIIKEVE